MISKYFQQYKSYRAPAGKLMQLPEQKPEYITLIISGYVHAYRLDDSGRRVINVVYGPGCFYPVLWPFLDIPTSVYYQTITELVYLKVAKADFLTKQQVDQQFSAELLQQVVTQFAAFSDRVENLSIQKSRERVLRRLSSLHKTYPDKTSPKQIAFPIIEQDIADSIGLSREVVSGVIKDLKAEQIISVRNKIFTFE
jgi:CRP-like cAMP-binding protein